MSRANDEADRFGDLKPSIFRSYLKLLITGLDTAISDFPICHQNDMLALTLNDFSGHCLRRGASSALLADNPSLNLFKGNFLSGGVPEVVAGDVLGILLDDKIDSAPVIN